MKMVKFICAMAVAAAIGSAWADGNWQSQVAKASQDAAVLQSTMQGLSDADQVAFYKAVNAAIAAMPGSSTEKAKLYVDAVRSALASANKSNKTAILAEAFATVSPEGLCAVNEALASGELAKGSTSDADFAKIAAAATDAIIKRCATADNAGARETFAILAFVRAAGASGAAVRAELVNKLDAETKDLAQNSWIDPALKGDYDPILGASDADQAPNMQEVASMGAWDLPANQTAAILGDLANNLGLSVSGQNVNVPDSDFTGQGLIGINAIPRTYKDKEDGEVKEMDPSIKRGHGVNGVDDEGGSHPHGYQDQW